jgi:hypothetical protein
VSSVRLSNLTQDCRQRNNQGLRLPIAHHKNEFILQLTLSALRITITVAGDDKGLT